MHLWCGQRRNNHGGSSFVPTPSREQRTARSRHACKDESPGVHGPRKGFGGLVFATVYQVFLLRCMFFVCKVLIRHVFARNCFDSRFSWRQNFDSTFPWRQNFDSKLWRPSLFPYLFQKILTQNFRFAKILTQHFRFAKILTQHFGGWENFESNHSLVRSELFFFGFAPCLLYPAPRQILRFFIRFLLVNHSGASRWRRRFASPPSRCDGDDVLAAPIVDGRPSLSCSEYYRRISPS